MTVRLTVAQATVRFCEAQHVERDGHRHRFFTACWGIFGHGNVAGIGQALLERELAGSAGPEGLIFRHGRNEQAMVHAATAYARQRDRLAAHVVTASVGPGSTNLVTGAAVATVNRLPVLLLPGDTFATRVADPVLQQLEDPAHGDWSVNDALRPVSAYFDRVQRPEQLASALLSGMRVLTDPAATGAVTLALPQDVQAEAHDWPDELFAPRTWYVARPLPERGVLDRALSALRASQRPLLVAGGGVCYSRADQALLQFAEASGIPVAETQAGKGALPYDHPLSVGAIGATGTTAANALAAEADLVIGVGTRWGDFTTASRSVFAHPDVRFVNINVAPVDVHKQSAVAVLADAREALLHLRAALGDWRADPAWAQRATDLAREWDAVVTAAYARDDASDLDGAPRLVQSAVIGAVNEVSDRSDVVVCAAGSMPGDLHKLWRTRDRKGYHVEYGFSCMGYEVAGGLGVKLAALDQAAAGEDQDRDVFVLVGDGSWLMMSSEIVTAVAEGVKIIVVLVQNHGYASIGALSESLGSQRFGTGYRFRDAASRRLDGDRLPVDLAANAASLGADVLSPRTLDELHAALRRAKESTRTTVVHVQTDPLVPAPASEAWWDVPVAEVSALDSTRTARATYESHKTGQCHHLAPPTSPSMTPEDPS